MISVSWGDTSRLGIVFERKYVLKKVNKKIDLKNGQAKLWRGGVDGCKAVYYFVHFKS